MLVDWLNDGRIDRTYRLQCYEDAVDGLPPDLRDYTNASEVIERALQSATRSRPTSARTPAAETSSTADRVLVALLVGMSLALLAAAALGILARRRGLGTTPPRR